jgi:hypothetical protein
MVREGGSLKPLREADAAQYVARRAGGKAVTVFLDGNIPCEEIASAASWCAEWAGAKVCVVIEPAEEQLLLGAEASGAKYLPSAELRECDGFLIIGDALAANPACARGLLDRRRQDSRTPVVVIDPAAGTASKFATQVVPTAACGELQSLAAVAAAAGADLSSLQLPSPKPSPATTAAGKTLAGCQRLAVLVAAEYGRGAPWQAIGVVAGMLAKARGGGLALQTDGANSLAALRMGMKLGAVPLATALADENAIRITIGCDLAGMLGWAGLKVLAAAAPLPNATTDAAEVILPLALPAEVGGTFLADGERQVEIDPLLKPPAGVRGPSGAVELLARAAGAGRSAARGAADPLTRATAQKPPVAAPQSDPPKQALLFGRQAAHAGSGALTGYGAWQSAAADMPELRLSVEDARKMQLKTGQTAEVESKGHSVAVRVQVAPELAAGRMVVSEGFAGTRALAPSRVDATGGIVAAEPVTASVRKAKATLE